MNEQPRQSRIQAKNRKLILDAALEAFSANGFRGTTLDQIAEVAGLSKPNVLYYFASKEAIHAELLTLMLDTWLDPLAAIDPTGEPVEEIIAYMLRKLDMSRSMPRESRLFAGEIIHGAPRLIDEIRGPLKLLVDEKAALIAGWTKAGRLADLDPYHLIFSIWATTQHYADFDVQIRAILKPRRNAHFNDAADFLADFYRAALTPR